PRSPARRELSASSTRSPCAVVSRSLDCAYERPRAARTGLPRGASSTTPDSLERSWVTPAPAGGAFLGCLTGRGWGRALVATWRFAERAPSLATGFRGLRDGGDDFLGGT